MTDSPTPRSAIRAVILDIGGVLCSYREGVDVDVTWARRLGITPDEFRGGMWATEAQAAAERGERSFEDFWEAATSTFGLDPPAADELYEDCWALTYLDDRVRRWVQALRPAHKVATLSNSWSDGRVECSRRYGLDRLVDLMVFSAEEGMAKPTAEIYLRTLGRLDVEAEEALFLDDRQDNVDGARALGIHALHVTGPGQLIADAASYLRSAACD